MRDEEDRGLYKTGMAQLGGFERRGCCGKRTTICAIGLVLELCTAWSCRFFDAICGCVRRSVRPVSERDETASLAEREGEAPSLGGNPRATSISKQFEPQTSDPARAGNVSAFPISLSKPPRPASQQTHNLNSSQQG